MIGSRKRLYPALGVMLALVVLTALVLKCMPVIKIALAALFISYLLAPVVLKLERKMKRSLAILVVYFSLVLIAAGVMSIVFFPVFSEINALPEYAYRLGNSLKALFQKLSDSLKDEGLMGKVSSSLQNALSAGTANLASAAFLWISGAAGFFANVLAAIALSWFFLIDWERMSLRIFLFVPSGIRPKAITALSSVRRDLGHYLRAQSLLILFMGALTVLVLWAIGTPMPVSLGMMYALLNAIPYFGPLIGTLPPVLAALAASPVNALNTLIALLIIQQIDNYILSPRIMGAASGSGPSTVLLAISVGSALYGIPGMFLALPTLVTAKSVYRVFTAPKT